jgi:membrane protein insertase Oxa1/YidC/SpoIIIJ
LQESVHFRLAGFLWIDNLAAPDMLLWWGENIPLISRPSDMGSILYLGPYLNLLPILAVTLMIFQQKMMMPPAADEQQAMQQKMMKYMMIFFGLMFYKVAAGLCVYFIASSLWGFTERKLLPKLKPVKPGEPADSLFQKAIGTSEPPKLESKPEPNGQYGANRAKRRQERKRKQERPGSTQPFAEMPTTKAEEDGNWWSNVRRKVGDWWKDLLKKAAKK